MSETNNSSFAQEEEEFFEHIDNEDNVKINEFLSKNKEIWKYKNKDNDDSNVLHISVYKKLFEITKLLINYCKEKNTEGLNDFVNAKNKIGTTPLHFAAFKGDVKIIKLLIENGADIFIKTKRELNIFHYSAQGNRPTSLMYFYLKYYFFAKPKDKILFFRKTKRPKNNRFNKSQRFRRFHSLTLGSLFQCRRYPFIFNKLKNFSKRRGETCFYKSNR